MPDKKITELPVAPTITGDDVGILVNNGTDYQYAFSELLSYIVGNIATGCNLTFVTTVPQNNVGNNLDVAININTGAFYQKQHSNWINTYTLPTVGNSNGSAIAYGLGEPNATSGQTSDTYIDTSNGTFYKKATTGWQQAFSMLSGPAGGPGPKGDTGLPGTNGKSLLSGPVDPSNQATGVDGDFYINTSTYTIFGPKQNSDWGAGTIIVPVDFDSKADKSYVDDNFVGIANVDQGLIITNDKKLKLDLQTKQLVTPELLPTWSFYKADGSSYTFQNGNPKAYTVDKGVKADLTLKYKYPAPSATQTLPQPQTAGGYFAGKPFPLADTFSETLPINNIVTDNTYNVTLTKPKSGLIVTGSQVTFPTGNDTTADSASISFRGRGFLTSNANLTPDDIQVLYNTTGAFQSSKTRTFPNITAGVGKYIWYIYDAALGEYTSIILNGVEAYFTAFQFMPKVTITNNAGVSTSLIIGRSNAPNAFTNVSLAFS
jgi:hypothetical protein